MFISYASVRQKQQNKVYPQSRDCKGVDDIADVVQWDHVCAHLRDGIRSNTTVEWGDCIVMDIDNAEGEYIEHPVTTEAFASQFPHHFYAVNSRNNMKEKHGLPAVPRFHVYIPLDKKYKPEDIRLIKEALIEQYPFFDAGAKDASRFIFGVEDPTISEWNTNKGVYTPTITPTRARKRIKSTITQEVLATEGMIPVGTRNDKVFRLGCRFLATMTPTKAEAAFIGACASCEEPLDDKEVNTIWEQCVHYHEMDIEEARRAKEEERAEARRVKEEELAEARRAREERAEAKRVKEEELAKARRARAEARQAKEEELAEARRVRAEAKRVKEEEMAEVRRERAEVRRAREEERCKKAYEREVERMRKEEERQAREYNAVIWGDDVRQLVGDKIRYNALACLIEYYNGQEWESLSDETMTRIKDYLYTHEEAGQRWARAGVRCDTYLISAIKSIAYANKVNPAIEWLEGLPQWDGQRRIGKYFIKAYGVKDFPEYARKSGGRPIEAFSTLWFLAICARAMEPGCKFDYVPILIGEQGIGKTRGMMNMLPAEFVGHSLTIEDIEDGKKASEKIAGKLISEIPELTNMWKRNIDKIKAFITEQVDTYRPAYERYRVAQKRTCCMYATSNQRDLLYDPTGNRRFIPLMCTHSYIEPSQDEKDQMWAEAYVYAKCVMSHGQKLYLPAYEDVFRKISAIAETHDELEDDIVSLAGELEKDKAERIVMSLSDIANATINAHTDMYGNKIPATGTATKKDQERVRVALTRLGITDKKVYRITTGQGTLLKRGFDIAQLHPPVEEDIPDMPGDEDIPDMPGDEDTPDMTA